MKLLPVIACLLGLHLGLLPDVSRAAEEVLTLGDGTPMKVLFFAPKLDTGHKRLALLIAGGTSNTFMARAQFWLGKELVDRGWAIAVPISPDGTGFGGDNARLLPELMQVLQPRHNLGGHKPLLVGISSGGSTALSIATRYPASFSGVVAAPGRLQEDTGIPALDGLPVYLRIGEKDDFRWHRQLEDMVAILRNAGAKVDGAIVPEARHIFQLDWDDLEKWLGTLQ